MVELRGAVDTAKLALKLPVEQRIQKFNFETRFSLNEKLSRRWTNHVKRGEMLNTESAGVHRTTG